MDGRTRVRNTIHRIPTDRIPRFDSFWEDTLADWRNQGLPADADPNDLFDFDIRMMYLDASMRQEQKTIEANDEFITFQDRAGYTVRKMVGKSRALEWLDHATKDKPTWQQLRPGFEFDPDDTARLDTQSYFAHMDPYPTWPQAKQQFDRLRQTGKCIAFTVYGPWEATWRHRGYEQLLMDLAIDPDWVCEMADAQSQLVIATLRHCIKTDMKPDALFLVDDLACTRGLLFSPEMWRQIFKPRYQQLGQFLRENDISFWLHCCGNCQNLIDDFLDCNLDVLQPLQAQADMDVRTLKPRYGHRLTFWGNIDVTKMAGPPNQCESEIRQKLSAAKTDGGYMYHSDHSIPPEVSFDRYQWIMQLVDQFGKYD